MNLLRHSLSVTAATLLASALLPGAVSASHTSTDGESAVRTNFRLSATNGYRVSFSGYGDEVSIDAEGPDGQAEYTVPGRVSHRGVWANFGKRGRVAVEFRPSGSFNKRVPPGRCEGRTRFLRFGSFVGTIRFAGEGGYTEVDAHSAHGNSYVERPWDCAPRKERGGRGCRHVEEDDESESIELDVGSPRHRASLTAYADRSPEEPGFTFMHAEMEERRERMEIHRGAFVNMRESEFVYDPALTFATLTPPRPFSGSATLRRSPDGSVTWLGDLRVSLPGAPNLALAGPAFEATLERLEPYPASTCFAAAFTALAD